MNIKILKSISLSVVIATSYLLIGTPAMADSISGNLSTGISGQNGNGVVGVVVTPPSANPAPGVYTSAQSVTLTAVGATSIYYTLDGSVPTCSSGTLYSSAINVSSSEAIQAISCYSGSSGNASSTVAAYLYAINPQNSGSTSSSGGGGGSYSSSGSVIGGSTSSVGIADFVLLMANWGQTGLGNPADWSGDAVVGIQDFIWLMAHWTI